MISVIISTRWASEILDIFIESLLKYQKYDNEIIVVADNPSWQILKLLQDRGFILGPCNFTNGERLQYHITNHRHLERNWNYGFDYANYEYVAFCPDDVVMGPSWDDAIMKKMDGSKRKIVQMHQFQRCVPVNHQSYMDFGIPEWKYSAPHKRDVTSDMPIGWDWNKWEQNCENAPKDIGGVFWVLHKELFELANRYSFHAGHPLGQELSFYERCKKLHGAPRVAADTSCIMHWGSVGNSDNQISSLPISDGFFECKICGHLDTGIKSEFYNRDPRSIEQLASGLYLCERCKKDGYRIENHKLIK